MGNFLSKNGFIANQRDLFAIVRRIDTNGSGKITYNEFSEFISTNFVNPDGLFTQVEGDVCVRRLDLQRVLTL